MNLGKNQLFYSIILAFALNHHVAAHETNQYPTVVEIAPSLLIFVAIVQCNLSLFNRALSPPYGLWAAGSTYVNHTPKSMLNALIRNTNRNIIESPSQDPHNDQRSQHIDIWMQMKEALQPYLWALESDSDSDESP